ncbi:MAG: uroporphyrinogen decarboxylase family protein [Planctomycetaceae bacterium]|nr:uroporphyrinogen decarboxylase family protein [Planctomycetaceae bacterium]
MNGFERISRTLAGQPTDHVPVMLHNFMPAAREAGLTMHEFRSCPEKMAGAFVDASRKYDLDGILTDVDTALVAHAMGAPTEFPDDMPARVVAPIADRIEEVIEQVDPKKLQSDERIQVYLEAIRLIHRETHGQLFLRGNADQGPFSLAVTTYGMMNMMPDLIDKSKTEVIFRLIERCYDVHLTFHRMVKEAGADMTSFGDSMGSPDLISPAMFRRFVAPYHKRLIGDLAREGIQTVCHICGKTDMILQPWSESGFCGVEIDYKTNIPQAAETMQGKSVVFGVVDPSGVFCLGDEAAVIQNTRAVLDCFPHGGLVIGAGCALPAETPSCNIHAFVQTVRSNAKTRTN